MRPDCDPSWNEGISLITIELDSSRWRPLGSWNHCVSTMANSIYCIHNIWGNYTTLYMGCVLVYGGSIYLHYRGKPLTHNSDSTKRTSQESSQKPLRSTLAIINLIIRKVLPCDFRSSNYINSYPSDYPGIQAHIKLVPLKSLIGELTQVLFPS